MKLSNYIEHLQKVLKNEGDLDLVYSSDDEGNAIHELWYAGSIIYLESVKGQYLEQIDVEELDDYDEHVTAYCIN